MGNFAQNDGVGNSMILASASPARLAILRGIGVEPIVRVADVDEDAILATAIADGDRAGSPLGPAEQVLVLARAKAEAVAALSPERTFLLGCDSMFEMGDAVVGKPRTAEIAIERLKQMRGGSGLLHTGHWLIDLRGDAVEAVGGTSTTRVHIGDLSDAEIEAYVATGEPLRVAGAFTIDGLGGPYVTGIEGDHHGVIGLSLPLFRELLLQRGVMIHELRNT